MRKCSDCGASLPPPRGRGRPPKRCDECRGVERPIPGPTTVREIRPGATQALMTLAEATERRLREAGKLEDPSALVVLQLAKSIDAGGHSGASLASLSREFRAALDVALVDETAGADTDDGLDWSVG